MKCKANCRARTSHNECRLGKEIMRDCYNRKLHNRRIRWLNKMIAHTEGHQEDAYIAFKQTKQKLEET